MQSLPPTGNARFDVCFCLRSPFNGFTPFFFDDAAQLSPRALQAAFRKHLRTTPLGYLQAVRMARVHADLVAARPGDGQTVSALANRWGFSQLSRFARDYKQRYGVSPRQTLGRSAE